MNKEVMFSSEFDCQLAGLRNNKWMDHHEAWWEDAVLDRGRSQRGRPNSPLEFNQAAPNFTHLTKCAF